MAGRMHRRDALKTAAAAGLAASLAGGRGVPGAPAGRDDRIRRENSKPGSTDWQLTYTRTDAGKYRCPWIEGYATRTSVRAGETLEICVSAAPEAEFSLDIYRMGWYGGAGGRRVARIEGRAGTQPTPEVGPERLRECRWEPTVSIAVPDDWLSGVYLGKLNAPASRCESYVVFVVADDRECDLLFQVSDNTWNAYNFWPDGYSLYTDGVSPGWALKPGVRASFDRPYGRYPQIMDNPLSQGSGEFLLWEFPLAFWLEEKGYDVSYISNADTRRNPNGRLFKCRGFLSVGHDEYWSLEMFSNVKEAVARGVNAAFLSGNTCCFVTPMTPNSAGVPDRTITRAGRYGGVSEEEAAYMGPFPMDGPNEAELIGARTVSPFNGSGDWIVRRPDHWLFEGTGMADGDAIPGLVGWEFHGDPAPIPGLEVVARGPTLNSGGKGAEYTATIYPGPKGNHVFNASTIFWAQGLSSPPGHMPPYSHYGRPHGPDARVRRITANLLNRFISST